MTMGRVRLAMDGQEISVSSASGTGERGLIAVVLSKSELAVTYVWEQHVHQLTA